MALVAYVCVADPVAAPVVVTVPPSPNVHTAFVSAGDERPKVVAVPAVMVPERVDRHVQRDRVGVGAGGSGVGLGFDVSGGTAEPTTVTLVWIAPVCAYTTAFTAAARTLRTVPFASVTPELGDSVPAVENKSTCTPGTNAPLAVKTVAVMSRLRSGRVAPTSRIEAGAVLGGTTTGVGAYGS